MASASISWKVWVFVGAIIVVGLISLPYDINLIANSTPEERFQGLVVGLLTYIAIKVHKIGKHVKI
jgi:hypothetical protein